MKLGEIRDEMKLPKIVLSKFSGDPLDWKSFKETFKAAAYGSDSISNIEKFTYLKTYDEWKLHS